MTSYFVWQEGSQELKLPMPKFMTEIQGSQVGSGAVAPMPGVVEKVSVQAGDKVAQGDPLVIMIAMKMEVSNTQISHCRKNISIFSRILIFMFLP